MGDKGRRKRQKKYTDPEEEGMAKKSGRGRRKRVKRMRGDRRRDVEGKRRSRRRKRGRLREMPTG